ncbi:MAG: cytochrome c oxidase subunit II [Planctomycetota bacterium]
MDNVVAFSAPVLAAVDTLGQLPRPGSTVAAGVDWIYMFIFWVSVAFFVPIVLLMVYFCVKYRRRSDTEPMPVGPTHNNVLEITWTVIPFILVCFMFYFGIAQYSVMATSPSDAYRIDVTAVQWSWTFTYPNPEGGGQVESTNELHAYVGQPFSLRMNSKDVIHAFWCPEMRVKRDVVPGRTDFVWFEPVITGDFWIFCTEYCGTSHSAMTAKLHVHPSRAAFEEALKKLGKLPGGAGWEKGLVIWERGGCKQCHSLDGAVATGPTWMELSNAWKVADPADPTRGAWDPAAQRLFVDGSSATVSDDYIRESILKPHAKTVAPYGQVMPASPRFLADPAQPENVGYVVDLIRVLATMPDLQRAAQPGWTWEQHLESVKQRKPEETQEPK